jgi:rubrerythrin
MMREPLLGSNPDFDEVTLETLIGIANAIERESVNRYVALERAMRRRGESETADAFATMRREEESHVDAVRGWAEALGEPVPASTEFQWRLPPELWRSWDDVIGSSRLTPYRAFAIAVVNEQRAFALYSYLSAQSGNAEVAEHAERLALEELRHAAVMRRWRRKAWHDERRHAALPPGVLSETEFHALAAEHEARIGVRLASTAQKLRAAGDHASATLLEELRAQHYPAAQCPQREDARGTGKTGFAPLLNTAQEPLEAFSEVLERVMQVNEGAVFEAAEIALTRVVRCISQIALRIEQVGGIQT